jgi:hypothetical protein
MKKFLLLILSCLVITKISAKHPERETSMYRLACPSETHSLLLNPKTNVASCTDDDGRKHKPRVIDPKGKRQLFGARNMYTDLPGGGQLIIYNHLNGMRIVCPHKHTPQVGGQGHINCVKHK